MPLTELKYYNTVQFLSGYVIHKNCPADSNLRDMTEASKASRNLQTDKLNVA